MPIVSPGLQCEQLKNPDARISIEAIDSSELLKLRALIPQGVKTGDDSQYRFLSWELPTISVPWRHYQSTPSSGNIFSGYEYVLNFKKDGADLARLQGESAWGRAGVAVGQMAKLPHAMYFGEIQDSNINVIIPKEPQNLPAVFAFVESPEFRPAIRALDQNIAVTNATVGKVAFNLERWQCVAAEKYPSGLPKPFSSDPTQWLFNGHPFKSDNPLQVAVARLLCYQWPRQTGSSFPDCPSLGPDGLEKHSDDDGVVPLSAINREEAAANRLRALLKDAYGAEWNLATTERELLSAAGHGDATLEDWLRDSF